MTDTPTAAAPRWSTGGTFPTVDARSRAALVAAVTATDRSAFKPPPWVEADHFPDETDQHVFGAVLGVWLVRDQPWLVRGVLRSVEDGPPVLARVAVEHFADPPTKEVTGSVMREINFATIRNLALDRLRERGLAIGFLHESGVAIFDSYRANVMQAADEAAKHKLARGPHGGYPAEHYRHIARRYLALVRSGRRDVQRALCEEESERLGELIKRERMREWVKKATQMGFLAPGERGKAGRHPGPNLNQPKEDNDG
jgi:hypothetical protein